MSLPKIEECEGEGTEKRNEDPPQPVPACVGPHGSGRLHHGAEHDDLHLDLAKLTLESRGGSGATSTASALSQGEPWSDGAVCSPVSSRHPPGYRAALHFCPPASCRSPTSRLQPVGDRKGSVGSGDYNF